MAGILGFCLANTYLGMKYFSNFNLQHHSPKIAGIFVFISYKASSIVHLQKQSCTHWKNDQIKEGVTYADTVTGIHRIRMLPPHSSTVHAKLLFVNLPKVIAGVCI